MVGVDGSSLQADSQPQLSWLGLRVGSGLVPNLHSLYELNRPLL